MARVRFIGWDDLVDFIRRNYVRLCFYKSSAAAPRHPFTKADLSPRPKLEPLTEKEILKTPITVHGKIQCYQVNVEAPA